MAQLKFLKFFKNIWVKKQLKLAEVESSFNTKIEVWRFLDKPRIVVQKMIQSGGLLELIWKKGIKKLKNFKVSKVLILGLGGGTAAELISQSFPQASIVGIEIDPLIIKLGKKYFKLKKIPHLKIIQADAMEMVNKQKLKEDSFDLILVDLYLGDQVPLGAESRVFLKNLKKLLTKKGVIIFNRIFHQEHKKGARDFIRKLDKFFSEIKLVRAWSNLLVFASG